MSYSNFIDLSTNLRSENNSLKMKSELWGKTSSIYLNRIEVRDIDNEEYIGELNTTYNVNHSSATASTDAFIYKHGHNFYVGKIGKYNTDDGYSGTNHFSGQKYVVDRQKLEQDANEIVEASGASLYWDNIANEYEQYDAASYSNMKEQYHYKPV